MSEVATSEEVTLYKAQVKSNYGKWIDGGWYRHREDAEAEALELAARYGNETQVVLEFPTVPHPLAVEIDRLQRRNSHLESENDELHDDAMRLLRELGRGTCYLHDINGSIGIMTNYYIQDGDDRMSTAQVVELLGLDRRRVERAAAAGKLRVDARLSMFNGARLYRPEDVHRWIAEVDAELAKQGLVRMRKAEAEGWRPAPQ